MLIMIAAAAGAQPCTITGFGGVADNRTDCTHAFRAAAESGCAQITVEPGVYLTGPFNLSSNTVLHIAAGATIAGSRDPSVYPVVVLQPLDEAYRAPHFNNSQYQALVSAYSASNVTVTGGGVIDGQGWDWWRNWTANSSELWAHQRPKLMEFVDCDGLTVSHLTLRNSPFWTFHPIFSRRVRASHLRVLAPRDHGNTDGVDPDSCDDVHVTDCVIDVGDDAVSVKSGLHWKTKAKVPAQNYLFERINIVHRNFAIGSDVSGDVRNISFVDSTIGDEYGSSPWAIKLKTDSQEGGIADGVAFRNVRIGNITYCGSSRFVYEKQCSQGKRANMLDVNMGYVGAKTNPGRIRNVIFDGLHGTGAAGLSLSAAGLPAAPGCPGCNEHIVNLTLRNISLDAGSGAWDCHLVDGFVADGVSPWPAASSCPAPSWRH